MTKKRLAQAQVTLKIAQQELARRGWTRGRLFKRSEVDESGAETMDVGGAMDLAKLGYLPDGPCCLLGAVIVASGGEPQAREDAEGLLVEAIRLRNGRREDVDLDYYNDEECKSKKQALRTIEAAINLVAVKNI